MIRKNLFLFTFLGILIISVLVVVSCIKEDYYNYNSQNDSSRNTAMEQELDTLRLTEEEISLVMSGDTSELMRVFLLYNFDENGDTISTYEDSIVLRTISRDVTPDSTNDILKHLVYRMYKTVNDPEHPGVGIAAPQVGINRKIIWVQRQDKPNTPFEVYFNPEIIQYSSQLLYGLEGCLSVPETSGYVKRPRSILIKYDDWGGNEHIEMVESYTARIFQHEIDHLNGILYVDIAE